MLHRGQIFLCLCIVMIQQYQCLPPIDPEVRAHVEDKVMNSMSLKELEAMVEKDQRVLSAPKNKLIIIPRGDPHDPNREAYVIERKIKIEVPKKEYRFSNKDSFEDDFLEEDFKTPLYNPEYRVESTFKFDKQFPSLFRASDLHSEESNPVQKFYESMVEKAMKPENAISRRGPSSSEDASFYKSRFDYESYAKDPTQTKLKGKVYWRDVPQRRDETVDENGCRTVVKKIIDPEDGKKSIGTNAKSVIITKECESPSIKGPDAKISEIKPIGIGSIVSEPSESYPNGPTSYESSRSMGLDLSSAKTEDPLAPDYIDRMLDTHFKSFPSFKNPLTSFRGYQERFKFQEPPTFQDIKPTIKLESYDHSHPESGFEAPSKHESGSSYSKPARTNKHAHRYEYPEQGSPETYEHHPRVSSDEPSHDYNVKKAFPSEDKNLDNKEPKMMKKSYAYYRKDNPKEDPNDQHYAEEYAQGNYRSFSSDYDSERDGKKKQ